MSISDRRSGISRGMATSPVWIRDQTSRNVPREKKRAGEAHRRRSLQSPRPMLTVYSVKLHNTLTEDTFWDILILMMQAIGGDGDDGDSYSLHPYGPMARGLLPPSDRMSLQRAFLPPRIGEAQQRPVARTLHSAAPQAGCRRLDERKRELFLSENVITFSPMRILACTRCIQSGQFQFSDDRDQVLHARWWGRLCGVPSESPRLREGDLLEKEALLAVRNCTNCVGSLICRRCWSIWTTCIGRQRSILITGNTL